MLSQSKLVSI